MINVKQTIYKTIEDKITQMRYHAVYNSETFRKILYLIIMDDLFDWADYKSVDEETQKKLKDKRIEFILNNPEFDIQRETESFYTNVNTPQTNNTWATIIDREDLEYINNDLPEKNTEQPSSFTPDPTCITTLVYFPNSTIKANSDGKPQVDLNNLTTCEKMNIYINRETGTMYYLTEKCTWEPLKHELQGSVKWDNIEGKPIIYNGIRHHINSDTNTIDVELLENGSPISSDIGITSDKDLEDIL